MDFSSKVALVTGGASGIGACCVEYLLINNIKGVIIADINSNLGEETSKNLNEKYGNGKTMFVKTDVTDKNSFEDTFRKAVEVYGNIDILLNSAGIFNEVHWERQIQINLVGTTQGCLLAINKYFPKYRSSPKTYIVNISSSAGLVPVRNSPHYTSTKFAVTGLSRSFGINPVVTGDGICVMCLCPGVTETPIFHAPQLVYEEIYRKDIATLKVQKPDAVAKAFIEILNKAESGSVWYIEDNTLSKVKFSTEPEFISSNKL